MKQKKILIGVGVFFVCIVIVFCGFFFLKNRQDTPVFMENEEGTWTITQYGRNDINMSFYTIYNEQKGLIVVDGGWTQDAADVREVINTLGGHVDAWILTHPHQDHIGAFNQ